MIHNVLIIRKEDGSIIARQWFWKIEFTDHDIKEFLVGLKELEETEALAKDTPLFVGKHKVFHHPINDELILLFVTDGRDEDRTIKYKVREGASRIATALRGNRISYIKDNLEDILGELIFTRFKVSFVGSGGVGKSTLLRLLFGKEPAPGGYVPTINVAVDSSETIQFGTWRITIWDFAGQAVFQDLWSFYFGGTDIIFLITDSSFRNVMQTKTLLRSIRKEAPGVPLFIIANKQDLPESMRADKIQRLLGAPTFPMVATDKTRREEFIRFMLEMTTKTIGVQLPDLPVSEMIVVRKRTEDIERSEQESKSIPEVSAGEDSGSSAETDELIQKALQEEPSAEEPETASSSRVLHLLLIVNKQGLPEVVYHLNFSEDQLEVTQIASLISALDSFDGVEGEAAANTPTSALETIEHEGTLIMVEKSRHFIVAIVVANDKDEARQRQMMTSLLIDIEDQFLHLWENWDGSTDVFESSIFKTLSLFPLRSVRLDYILRVREAGSPIPFNNRDVGKALVMVKSGIEPNMSVGSLVRSLDLPRDTILGCLQILNYYGWIDFHVDISESSVLKCVGEPPDDIVKAYGQVIHKFLELCDGQQSLEDIVRKLNVSIAPMKFVTQKLVLSGALEIVA